MKKIQKNYELNAGESFRLDKNGARDIIGSTKKTYDN